MELGITVIAGALLRWAYNAIKRNLGLSGNAAAWGVMGLSLPIAFGITLGFGGFAGIDFNAANPGEALQALGAAWAAIYATAAGWHSVAKNGGTSSKR